MVVAPSSDLRVRVGLSSRLAERVDTFGETLYAERTNMGLGGSVVVDEHERWLCRDSKVRPHRTGLVNDVGEGAHFEG